MEELLPSIYVLGSSGFIGRELLTSLKSRYAGGVKSAGRTGCDVYVDLAEDYSELVNVTTDKDIVVFLSSISSPDICKQQPELAQKVNVTSTIDLIQCLTKKGVKVIFTSTDMVFGNSDKTVCDSSSLAPFGEYGEMKADVEHAVYENSLVKVIRFSYVLGEGDKYTTMMVERSKSEEELEVFHGFERNVVSLDDVTCGIYKLIVNWDSVDSMTINFCGPELISRLRITELFNRNVCSNLKYKAIEAPSFFWKARPKTIKMRSDVFSTLLGREPITIEHKLKKWRVS